MKKWLALAALFSLPSDQPPSSLVGDHVLIWSVVHPEFGGFSAIEVSESGQDFLALTDRGVVFPGSFDRTTGGALIRVVLGAPVALTDDAGAALAKDRNDTEGLALQPDGSFLVSLEGQAEVLSYSSLGAPAAALPGFHPWRALEVNAGLEALAVGPDGFVHTLPERARNNFSSVHEFRNGRWNASRVISIDDGFLPVAADFGPDGWLYILERRFVFPGGFDSRLRRFTDHHPKGDMIWSSPPGGLGNLEGLSIWLDPQHRLRATMISDDNFHILFQTQLVEIAIGD